MLALLDGRLAGVPAVLLLEEGRLLVVGRLLTVGRLLVEGRLLTEELLLEGLLTLPLALGRDVLSLIVGREAESLTELLPGTLGLAPPETLLLCRGFGTGFCGFVIIELAEPLLP